jgi:hypothetical protein
MPWKLKAHSDLQRQVDTLAIKLLRANSELRSKTVYCQRLEFLLHQRTERIDQLTGVIDQLRSANQKLGLENDCLTALLVAPAPQLNGAKVAAFDRGEL